MGKMHPVVTPECFKLLLFAVHVSPPPPPLICILNLIKTYVVVYCILVLPWKAVVSLNVATLNKEGINE